MIAGECNDQNFFKPEDRIGNHRLVLQLGLQLHLPLALILGKESVPGSQNTAGYYLARA